MSATNDPETPQLDPPADLEVDAVGLLCPLPVLKLRKTLARMGAGQVVALLASDPAAIIDVPHFCQQDGHAFLGCADVGEAQRYLVRKAP